MRLIVEAPAPTDLDGGKRKGTSVQWGSLQVPDGWKQDPENAGNWHWQPFLEIQDVDTFWGYIRDDLERERNPKGTVIDAYSGVWPYQGAEGHVQLEELQLILWAERPKTRMAMLLWGFQPKKVDLSSTGTGILYRGNTVLNVQEATVQRSDGMILSLRWKISALIG